MKKNFIKKLFTSIMAVMMMTSLFSCGSETNDNSSVDDSNPSSEEVIYQKTKDYNEVFSIKKASLRYCQLNPYHGTKEGVAVSEMQMKFASICWTVDVPETAYYAVGLHYMAQPGVSFDMFINETERHPLNFIGDRNFRLSILPIRLNKGKNTVKIRNPQGQGYFAAIDELTVSGFETPSEITTILKNTTVYEGQKTLEFPNFDGFNLFIDSTSNQNVIEQNGAITTPNEFTEVKVKVVVERNNIKSTVTLNVNVDGKTPSAENIAKRVKQEENGKVIIKGRTNIDKLQLEKGINYVIIDSDNKEVISKNGTVNAKKDDCVVKLKYRILKPDGSFADTDWVSYTVTGLGFEPTGTFMNPIVESGDPNLNYLDGWYYQIRPIHGPTCAHLEMIRSKSFLDWTDAEFKVLYRFLPYETGAWNSQHHWSPYPIMKWSDGHYYIYYCADDGDNANHRQGVLKSKTTDPMGEYEDLGMINTSDLDHNENPTALNTCWAIGATVFQGDDNKWYLVWSGTSRLGEFFPCYSYIAEIRSPADIGARVAVGEPTEDWEGVNMETPIMEGQKVFNVNGKFIMLYSANASWAGRYSEGMLVYENKHEGGFMNPKNWTKKKDPVFVSTSCINAPGGASIVQTPDGKEWWAMYHADMYVGSGWTRYVCAKPIRLDEEGLPVFDDPIPYYTPVRMPSGDTFEQPYMSIVQAEDAVLEGNVSKNYDIKASNGEYVTDFKNTGDKVTFTFNVEKEGLYSFYVRYATEGDTAIHVLKINEKNVSLPYLYYGYDSFYTTKVKGLMKKGENKVTVEYISGCNLKLDFVGVAYAGE